MGLVNTGMELVALVGVVGEERDWDLGEVVLDGDFFGELGSAASIKSLVRLISSVKSCFSFRSSMFWGSDCSATSTLSSWLWYWASSSTSILNMIFERR